MNKKVGIAVIAAILIAAAILVLKNNPTFENTSFAMNTFINISITDKDAKETGIKILNTVSEFENHNSMYIDGSAISQINANAGKSSVSINQDTYELLKRAYTLCEQSDGRFDITIGPLVKAWNITSDNPAIPQISSELMSLVNYRDMVFYDNNSSVMLRREGQIIDLGGIAKGSVCDKIYSILEEAQIKKAAISIGGNVVVYGDDSYKVGIQHPRNSSELIATVRLKNKIISTTGDYERYFEVDGKRYHHIIDPSSGQPYESDFYSVTVIGNDGALADYLSTLLFMTPKEGLMQLLDDYSIIAFGKDNLVYVSPDLSIELLDNSFSRYNG